jgi:hypothetical protein
MFLEYINFLKKFEHVDEGKSCSTLYSGYNLLRFKQGVGSDF